MRTRIFFPHILDFLAIFIMCVVSLATVVSSSSMALDQSGLVDRLMRPSRYCCKAYRIIYYYDDFNNDAIVADCVRTIVVSVLN